MTGRTPMPEPPPRRRRGGSRGERWRMWRTKGPTFPVAVTTLADRQARNELHELRDHEPRTCDHELREL
jgi:hypothetical protein